MKLPTLSVVIPNFNHAQPLRRCLDALINQSVQPYEIVVVDDASTDNSVEVIREYAAKCPFIKLLRNDKNQKVMYTTNRGIDAATGEFVFLQAADDEVLPGFLEKSLQLLAQYPQAGLSCTIGDWREKVGEDWLNWHMGVGMTDRPAYIPPQEVVKLEQEGRFFIPGHSAIYRREALIEVDKLIPKLSLYSDWFATTTLALRHGICVVPEPLAIFYIEPNTFFQNARKDRETNDAAIEHALRLLISPKFDDVVDLFAQAGSLYICGEGTLRVLDQHEEFARFRTARYLRKVKWHVRKVWLKKHAPAFLLNWYVRVAGYWTRPTVPKAAS
jgi:glycosyltransferase involved in cell wall biosynthesis